MTLPGGNPEFRSLEARRFVTTPWTEIMLARNPDLPGASRALDHLCRLYWYPIYAHIRYSINNPHDAEDLPQEFFRLLVEKNYLGAVDRRRGKFRSFLLVVVKRFLVNSWKRATRLKRGGGQNFVSLDLELAESEFHAELSADISPEQMFERRWAEALLDQALARLRQEYADRQHLFDCLQEFLTQDSRFRDYAQTAARLGMTPSAIAVSVHRLRQRYRHWIREEVRLTLVDPAEVDDEVRHLRTLLSK